MAQNSFSCRPDNPKRNMDFYTIVTCQNKPFFKTLARQFPTEFDALASLLRQSRKHNSVSSSRYPSEGPNLAFVVLPRFHHPLGKPISARLSVSIGSATSTLRPIAPWWVGFFSQTRFTPSLSFL
ncbi:hypothetical protein PIB30_026833 [Stylosanthes scabra]|uniref:Uncharacterized protein n=1 Tax=Stylosanthes scabra TaxID=79078 RepID=A0ABU6RAR7_9FABA|nr:hypothetical protein [Stylosanthes scabra]